MTCWLFMTSWHGNAVHIAGPSFGISPVTGVFPSQRDSYAGCWVSVFVVINLNKLLITHMWPHYYLSFRFRPDIIASVWMRESQRTLQHTGSEPIGCVLLGWGHTQEVMGWCRCSLSLQKWSSGRNEYRTATEYYMEPPYNTGVSFHGHLFS